jgi:hypothetical protein
MDQDRKLVDDDVGIRDVRFAMTGILIVVAVAIVLAIVS